jgi:hypothetical protein
MDTLGNLLNQPFGRHVALVIALVVFIHLCRWVLTWQAQLAANHFAKNAQADLVSSTTPRVEGSPATAERKRLLEQLEIIKKRAQHHFDVTVFFYTRYYMAIALFAIVGGTAAIALLFITRFGLSGVNPYVITIFLVTSGHAAFYAAFPRIFRQEENIADNKMLYTRYIALQNELQSYFTTREAIDGKWKTEKEFVHYVDHQMATLHNFAIGFDYTKVPNYAEQFEALKR